MNSYLAQPLAHVKRRARLAGIQVVVPHNAYLRKTLVEVAHIAFQGFLLRRRPRILGLHGFVAATHIHDVPAHAVVACCAVSNLPRVHLRVLVVVHQTLHAAVKVHHIRVAHLLPATPTLAYRVGVPVAYLLGTYLTAFRRSGAVDDEILHWLAHYPMGSEYSAKPRLTTSAARSVSNSSMVPAS